MIYYSYSANFPFSSEVWLSSPLSLGWTWLCSCKNNLEQVMASKINSEYAYGLGGGASVLVLSQHSLFSQSFFHSKFSAWRATSKNLAFFFSSPVWWELEIYTRNRSKLSGRFSSFFRQLYTNLQLYYNCTRRPWGRITVVSSQLSEFTWDKERLIVTAESFRNYVLDSLR